jgi:chromosome segregation ATPase
LAVGLFVAFLLVRNTLTVSAQQVFQHPNAMRASSLDVRSRRVAALEAQEQALALRQHEIEAELELTGDSQRKLQYQIDRETAEPDAPENPSSLTELSGLRAQLVQKKAELRQELERVQGERLRVQEDWRNLTGLRVASR